MIIIIKNTLSECEWSRAEGPNSTVLIISFSVNGVHGLFLLPHRDVNRIWTCAASQEEIALLHHISTKNECYVTACSYSLPLRTIVNAGGLVTKAGKLQGICSVMVFAWSRDSETTFVDRKRSVLYFEWAVFWQISPFSEVIFMFLVVRSVEGNVRRQLCCVWLKLW